jgi:hypothetical protein
LTCNILLDTINKYHRQGNLERFGLMAIGLLVRLLEFVSRCGDHIIRRQRPPDPLQLGIADRLDLYGIFDLRQHSRADEDLPWFGLVAEPGGDVRYGPDGRIVEASFKPDGAERGNPGAIPMPKPMSCPSRRHPSVNLSSARRKVDAIGQLQLTFGTKYVAMESRYPLASARRNI